MLSKEAYIKQADRLANRPQTTLKISTAANNLANRVQIRKGTQPAVKSAAGLYDAANTMFNMTPIGMAKNLGGKALNYGTGVAGRGGAIQNQPGFAPKPSTIGQTPGTLAYSAGKNIPGVSAIQSSQRGIQNLYRGIGSTFKALGQPEAWKPPPPGAGPLPQATEMPKGLKDTPWKDWTNAPDTKAQLDWYNAERSNRDLERRRRNYYLHGVSVLGSGDGDYTKDYTKEQEVSELDRLANLRNTQVFDTSRAAKDDARVANPEAWDAAKAKRTAARVAKAQARRNAANNTKPLWGGSA